MSSFWVLLRGTKKHERTKKLFYASSRNRHLASEFTAHCAIVKKVYLPEIKPRNKPYHMISQEFRTFKCGSSNRSQNSDVFRHTDNHPPVPGWSQKSTKNATEKNKKSQAAQVIIIVSVWRAGNLMQTEGFSIYGTSCFARERRKASLSNGTRGGNGGWGWSFLHSHPLPHERWKHANGSSYSKATHNLTHCDC